MRRIFIACQGWNYKDWITIHEPVFYPRGTQIDQMLSIYSEVFDAVEVDSTFYAIPNKSVVESWYRKTPEWFRFALKMPREISHEKFLSKESFKTLEAFIDAACVLQDKLMAILIQLPSYFEANRTNALNFRNFLRQLPKHLNFAVEFRQDKWLIDWTFNELNRNNVSLCLVEGEWISREKMFQAIEHIKNDFCYVRFMGKRDITTFDRIVRPQDENLIIWKEALELSSAETLLISFSNFYEGFAPESANKMRKLFGLEPRMPVDRQASLF